MRIDQVSCEIRLNGFFAVLLDELQSTVAYRVSNPAAIRQVQRARKRARFVNKELHDKAVSGFIADNDYVAKRSLTLEPSIIANARHFIVTTLERVTSDFDEEDIQNPLNLDLLFSYWKFGPGASNGIKGSHAAEKIEQDMTCTSRSAPLVFKLRQNNAYFQLNDERKGSVGLTVIQGSRLTTVPKNEDTERTIAIEPSGNMALQLAAGEYLTRGLRYIGLDIRSQQPLNKALALRGSMDGGIATIDLKSASNLYGLDLIRLLMPEKWVRLLEAIRSEEIELPDGTSCALNMVSTMGNGFTFPLMTLVNAALLYGFRCGRGGPNLFIDWSSSAIFGDDIIVPTEEYLQFCDVLVSAGLVVNSDKSFSDGPFRESCGGDYHLGVDITPFYAKSLATDSEIYSVFNQLISWSAKCNIWLPRTGLYLKKLLSGKVYFVPEWHNPDQGLLTALVPRRYKYLQQVASRERLENSNFEMMLAVGGYTNASGPHTFYSPRQYNSKWVVRKSRLPNGFLDGSDPTYRTESATFSVAVYIATLFNDDLRKEGIEL